MANLACIAAYLNNPDQKHITGVTITFTKIIHLPVMKWPVRPAAIEEREVKKETKTEKEEVKRGGERNRERGKEREREIFNFKSYNA